MPKKNLKAESLIIGWEESMELLRSLQDLTTNQLLNYANFIVLGYFRKEEMPYRRFDLRFFLESVKEFCANKDFLKSVLDGNPESFPSEYLKIEKDIYLLKVFKHELPSNLETKADFTALSHFVNLNEKSGFLSPLFERINFAGHFELVKLHPAMKLISSVEDPITKQLLHYANFIVLYNLFMIPKLLKSDFDLLFFTEVMKDFCADHLYLRKILDGEDLRWFSDDESISVA